jgi:hypothetical protein
VTLAFPSKTEAPAQIAFSYKGNQRMSRVTEIQQSEIVEVEQLIRPHIRRTPVVEIRGDDFDLGDIRLTLELVW